MLSGLGELRLCTAYELNGQTLSELPYDDFDKLVPVYETMPGWTEDITKCRSMNDLPVSARSYVARIEELAGCKIGLVSVGADRNETIMMHDPFKR